jgi:hypothetical protein
MSVSDNQVLVFRFESDPSFEGQLVGAIERIESGGAIRVLDVLFVAREPDTGELVAASAVTERGSGAMVASMLEMRLDPKRRKAITARALEGDAGEDLRALGAGLAPGHAIFMVLVQHAWARTLHEAAARVGGAKSTTEFVDAGLISEMLPSASAMVERLA